MAGGHCLRAPCAGTASRSGIAHVVLVRAARDLVEVCLLRSLADFSAHACHGQGVKHMRLRFCAAHQAVKSFPCGCRDCLCNPCQFAALLSPPTVWAVGRSRPWTCSPLAALGHCLTVPAPFDAPSCFLPKMLLAITAAAGGTHTLPPCRARIL